MRISRLELFGFKSFPDRTTFHFGRGVSCVVGPNGCGKSNVVDALRWCIGEQSPRSLRGSDMQDVIFAGSVDRRPVGFAEVQLTLMTDGEDPFPGDYAALREVQIGRRLHRSGASEYLINQGKVRRRDVVELLLDTGIGNNLYSFIEQGQVDKVITATPEERRSVIDEAAGIARYKARREEAKARLEATATQLDRASDVADEMARRLRALERQVIRAARFRRLRARIRLAELRLALVKVQALSADRRALREQLRAVQGQEAAARRELARREEDLAERRGEIEIVEAVVGARRDAVADLDAAIREQDATRRLQEQRMTELASSADAAAGEVERAEAELERASAEAEAAGSEQQQVVEELDLASEARAAAAVEAECARANATETEAARVAAERAHAAVVRDRVEAEAELGGLRARLGDLATGAARESGIVDELARRLVDAERDRASARQALEPVRRSLEAARAREAEAAGVWTTATEAARVAEQTLGEGRRRGREALEQARRRGQRWVDAIEARAASAARAVEVRWRDRLTTERAAAEAALAERTRTLRAEAEGRARAALGALDAELSSVRSARDEAEAAVEAARTARGRAEEGVRGLEIEVAEGRARHAALVARIAAVAPALEGVPRLVDLVPAEAREDLLRRLGEDALLPVVRDPAALSGERAGEPIRVWLLPGDELPEPVSAPWVEDRAEALVRYLRDRAPIAAPGLRVYRDLAVLGASDVARDAAEVARLERDLAVLEQRRRASAEEIERLVAADAAARGAREAAEAALSTCRSQVERERKRIAEQVDDEVREASGRLRREVVSALEALEAQRLVEVDAERASGAEAVDAGRAGLLDALSRIETDLSVGPLEAALARSRDAREVALRARDEAREAVAECRLALGRAEEASRSADLARDGIARERGVREEQVGRLREQHAQVLAELGAVESKFAELQASEASRSESLVGVREAASSAAGASGSSQERLAAARTLEVALRERLAAFEARARAAAERRAEAAAAIERAHARRGEVSEALARATRARDAASAELAEAQVARATAWDALEVERARLKQLKDGLVEAEQALRSVRERVDALTSEAEGLAGRAAVVQSELEVLRRRMEERYQVSVHGLLDRLHTRGCLVLEVDEEVARGLTLGAATVDGVQPVTLGASDLADEDQVVELLAELEEDRAQLAGLGEVNLAALEEYTELAERHRELEAQREDLEESLSSIRAAIAKMNRLCRERFRDAFDQVSEHFQETYPRLVGGGTARLSLTDDEDILEAGVEIFVQPPGKRLQNLGLLSGGEKAMTAIALLISLFRVKPSPFCVLDEVDAPLDEANGARFNEMLKEMSTRSQFLVITHNRKTMECADTLYGITMARPGVSRLVSVRL